MSKTFLEVSKQILNLFWGNFLKKNCPVHPGKSKLGKTSKNWKTFIFFKMPKYVPKSVQTCFQHASRYFFRWKVSPSAPWRVEKSKKFKKYEKISYFQNPEKHFQKCPNLFWADFFRTFLDQCTLEIKTCRNSKKKSKMIEFLKVFKNVLKSFQTSVELVLRYFSGKNCCPVDPGGSKHGNTSQKWKNFHFSSKCPEKFKHVLNMLWGSFFGKKNWPVHPRVSKLGKIRKKRSKKNWIFKSVQKLS